MRRFIATATVLAAVLTTAAPAYAQTIAFVDTARVLMSYQGARSAQGQMQKELMAYQQEFAERQKKIAEAQKAGKTQAEIQKMTESFEKELQPMKSKAMQLEQKLSQDVKKRIEGVINKVAKSRKADLVLDKAAVLFGGIDITEDVIRALK